MDIDSIKKKKIAVLAGGWSEERKISLLSGKAVSDSLERSGIKHEMIDLKKKEDCKNISGIDLAFIALHGRGGEDGYIQEILEKKEIKYTGSNPQSSHLSMDKVESKKVWRELHLPTPDFVEINDITMKEMSMVPHLSGEGDITSLDKSFVVKPAREGSSLGISIVNSEKDSLEKAMLEASRFDNKILIEAYVVGKEITIGILGDKALDPIMIKPSNSFYDFEAKYESESTEYVTPELDKNELDLLKEYSLSAFNSLGCSNWGRVDFIQDDYGNFQLIELNTIPGLTEKSLFPKSASKAGINFDELISQILFLSC
mgnify:CR=1 FL=1|tara:strand:- start:16312 stop:17256 length:945 start_codon:yes stop_codon:yes gene_type:complete